jgi:nitroreductase
MGIEPTTPCLQSRCSSQLSYSPETPDVTALGRSPGVVVAYDAAMEVGEAIRGRRMVRAYESRPVDAEVLDRVLDAARRAPSAGSSQPVDLLVLTSGDARERFWQLAFPVRDGYRWPTLFDAPVVVVPVVEPDAYARRYALEDKAATGLDDLDAWPVPYWWIDGGAAVQNLLIAAHGEGLGASFFGLFVNEREILDSFGVPATHRALGGITVGHAREEARVRSTPLPRRTLEEVTHREAW